MELPRCDLVEHRLGDADVGHANIAAQAAARIKEMARLAAEEGHGQTGTGRRPHHRARVAMNTARHIDGQTRRACFVDRVDHLPGDALNRPGKPGAEQSIDDNVRRIQQADPQRMHRLAELARPSFGIGRRVTGKPTRFTEQREGHVASGLMQQSRDNEAVAAIVAGPAQDEHAPVGPARLERLGDRCARTLHQVEGGHAVRRGTGVGRVHLGDGQQLGRIFDPARV